MDSVFDVIKQHYANHETIPDYRSEKRGLEKMDGVLQGVQMDNFYPTLEEKAAYLLIQINKGHFFSNGNKRVALVTTLTFVLENDYAIYSFSKEQYRERLAKLFPKCKDYQDYNDFLPEEFGFYNLSIVIAESEKYIDGFEQLKGAVVEFLKFALAPPGENREGVV